MLIKVRSAYSKLTIYLLNCMVPTLHLGAFKVPINNSLMCLWSYSMIKHWIGGFEISKSWDKIHFTLKFVLSHVSLQEFMICTYMDIMHTTALGNVCQRRLSNCCDCSIVVGNFNPQVPIIFLLFASAPEGPFCYSPKICWLPRTHGIHPSHAPDIQ